MEWLVAVAVSVGFGVLTGWVYGGFLSLRKGRRAGRRVHLSRQSVLCFTNAGTSFGTSP
jgi:hypothetical protein